PAGSVIDHEAPGEQDGRATSSAQSQRVLAQSQGVFGTRTDPVRVARPPPSRPLVPDLLGQHLVLVNGTKSFTIPDRADDSNPNMLCVTTARLRVLAHVPSSLRTCPCPIELCLPAHAPSSSAKLLFWTRISTTSQSSAGVLGGGAGGGARRERSESVQHPVVAQAQGPLASREHARDGQGRVHPCRQVHWGSELVPACQVSSHLRELRELEDQCDHDDRPGEQAEGTAEPGVIPFEV